MRTLLLIILSSVLMVVEVAAQTTGTLVDTLVVSSSSGNSTLHTGDTLTFCYTVSSFAQVNSGWFHGVEIKAVAGFDTTYLQPISAATSCDGQGAWGYYLSDSSVANHVVYGHGFYYDGFGGVNNGTGQLDGLPGNNYGDNCATHIWTFCWKMRVGNCTGTGSDSVKLNIIPTPDGVTGSWTGPVVYPTKIYVAPYYCCSGIQYASTPETQFGACNGTATVTATAHPPYTYHWADGNTTASRTGLCPGVYPVTVTDGTGCSEGHLFTIVPFDTLSYSVVVNAGCYTANNGSVRVNVVSGSGPFHFTLNGTTQTTNLFANVHSGTYNLIVTDALGNADTTVVMVPVALPVVDSANTVITHADCAFTYSGSISLALNGTAPYHFLWSNGDTTRAIVHVLAGSYRVTVTDANLCTYQTSFTIQNRDGIHVSPVLDTASCPQTQDGGLALNLSHGVAPYHVTWHNGDTTAILQNIYAGSYNVHVVDSFGCQLDTVITVPYRYLMTVRDTMVPVDCNGQHTGFASVVAQNGAGPYSYAWSNGALADTVGHLAAGVYVVTVADQNNCLLADTITVTQPDSILLNATVVPTLCAYDTVGRIVVAIQGGYPPYQFNWSNGRHSASDYRLASGNYALTVVDSAGCTHVSSYYVGYLDSMYSATVIDTPTCSGTDGAVFVNVYHDGPLGGNNHYVWSTGDTTSGLANITAGSYTLTVTSIDSITCRLVTTYQVVDACHTGIDEQENLAAQVLDLPNGKSFLVRVALLQNQPLNMQVFNAIGQLVYSSDIATATSPTERVVDLSTRATGIYFIRLQSGNSLLVKKVMVR